ncbi:MAG: hypothetical protein NC898_02510 [Candidatus Omnitrophica bacterium]|nr:hypothetical protein [Candidatus Omnitrophota bacterium]MCM8793325.1 hypothetical protein [Candidatus Omnitrophota bacterium]
MKKECLKCSQLDKCQDSFVSWIFFLIGLIAAIAIRVVVILDSYHPWYGKIAWYVGVLGFFIFFVYKFKLDNTRSILILKADLVNKIDKRENLSFDDYRLIKDILCALSSRKDRINYFFIFFTSIIAFLLALYLDIFRR